jgi:hypothetical protein
MSATYWVEISDELMDAGITWPDGMGLADPQPPPARPSIHGMQWYQVRDDHAPAGLNGQRVWLILRLEGRTPVVAGRELLPTQPGLTPETLTCCGMPMTCEEFSHIQIYRCAYRAHHPAIYADMQAGHWERRE